MQGDQWKKTTLKMALLFPGVLFAIFFALNMLVWGQKSSGAVPFGTLFALFFLWFGISTPLVFIGSYFGYKKPAPEDPVRTNKIPRQIPDQACASLSTNSYLWRPSCCSSETIVCQKSRWENAVMEHVN